MAKRAREEDSASPAQVWSKGPPTLQYEVLCFPTMEETALKLQSDYPTRFRYHKSVFSKFDDGGTDNIMVGGLDPVNYLRGRHVLFLASFHNNDVTMSQLHAFVVLLQSFIQSFTVVLPFYPVGTMDRVHTEGTVATANTLAQLFSGLPSCASPTRLMIYDLHTLQNRFYFSANTVASLVTAVPLLLQRLESTNIDCIAFPDDGAGKRFGQLFPETYPRVTCAKKREGDERKVFIMEGECTGKHIVIVDDLTRTGRTLYECGVVLQNAGAASVSVFVTHGVFPFEAWRHFVKGGKHSGLFTKFWLTNSIPNVTGTLPRDDVFEVLDLTPQIVEDL